MKPARHESTKQTSPKRRKRRARPTPRWLTTVAEGPEAVAQRRCLLILSVLSGELPVTDAIERTDVSRQLYYQLEEKALRAMMRALTPSAEGQEDAEASLAGEVEVLKARVKQLETEKRRAERLLLLTRKLVRPGPVKLGKGGRRRRSAAAGPSGSRVRLMKIETPLAPAPDSSTTTGVTTP